MKKELAEKKECAKTQKEADSIQANLVALEDADPRRPRCAYFGELEQMDATPYEWIPGQVWHSIWRWTMPPDRLPALILIHKKRSTDTTMCFTRCCSTMVSPISSSLTAVPSLLIKRKIPHLPMRIPIHSLPMPVNSLGFFGVQQRSTGQRACGTAEPDPTVTAAGRTASGRHHDHRGGK